MFVQGLCDGLEVFSGSIFSREAFACTAAIKQSARGSASFFDPQ